MGIFNFDTGLDTQKGFGAFFYACLTLCIDQDYLFFCFSYCPSRLRGWMKCPFGWMTGWMDGLRGSFRRIQEKAQVCYFNNVWFMFLVLKKNFYLSKEP
jgi:hypothetical protein